MDNNSRPSPGQGSSRSQLPWFLGVLASTIGLILLELWLIYTINPTQVITPNLRDLYEQAARDGTPFRQLFAQGVIWGVVMLSAAVGATIWLYRRARITGRGAAEHRWAVFQLWGLLSALVLCSAALPNLSVEFGLSLTAYDAGLPPTDVIGPSWLYIAELCGLVAALIVGLATWVRCFVLARRNR